MIPYRELARKKSGEVKGNFDGGKTKWQPNDGSMGSTVYLLSLMQHVVPELGLAEVIVATGKPATPHQATARNG